MTHYNKLKDFYSNITGEWYNNLPLSEQMEVLKKYYPIGHVFHWKQPNSSDPRSVGDYKEYTCRIESYIEAGPEYYPTAGHGRWYILGVTNLDAKTINIRCGLIKETIHPGFLRPAIWEQRNEKLEKLGI